MRVSVIVPVYNGEATLGQVVKSLERQRFSGSFEVLMVDNASSDSSAAIIQASRQVKYVYEPKPGAYAARNRAAREAQGDILAFLDSDSTASPGWLEAISAGFQCWPQAQVLLGCTRPAQDKGVAGLLGDYENDKARYACGLADARKQVAYCGNMAVRRETWERYGPFVELRRGGDVVFVRRVRDGTGGSVRYCPDMTARHLEFASEADYLRKWHIYGQSIQTYSQVYAADPLDLSDRLRIFRECVQSRGYGPWRTAGLATGLLAGWAAYEAGRWRARAARADAALLASNAGP